MTRWSPTSWRSRPIRQQPTYSDPKALHEAINHVRSLPPLVAPGEVDALRERLAAAARGELFVLQGGDCAERFADCRRSAIENKLKILLQMSLVLTWGARIPVVRIGRMAGQYAKPRSSDTEVIDGRTVCTYRGDHVNGHDPSERVPDPKRLLQAYFYAAATLNYARALLDGGFADLHHPDHWDLGWVRDAELRSGYESVRDRMLDAIDFFEATGMRGDNALRSVELYASHEGLLLAYEEALTEASDGGWYNLGAHMLWIGHRTHQLDGAHVEYFRGVHNPIGIKVGPGTEPKGLQDLLDVLDPDDLPGRIMLISRFGAGRVTDALPPLVEAVRATGRTVLWSCDPMHGNTIKTPSGLKTRDFGAVRSEIEQVLAVHDRLGTILGGVHFELTGEDVTECTGGAGGLSEDDLSRSYETFCDPRLNYSQSLEMAFLLAQRLSMR